MALEDKDPVRDQSQANDTSARDQASDKLQDAARGGGPSPSVVQAAQSLTGTKLLQDIMAWQTQITALPSQTDPNGNVVAFNTDDWNEEHYEKAGQLQKQIPQRMQVYGAKTQLTNKDLGQIKTMMDLEEKIV
jgi:hypothetical protein